MAIIRTQHLTPSYYSGNSRDFQLFCRLYDSTFNEIQYNIDTMLDIIDTAQCRDNMLPLLQTKLGFFSKKDIRSEFLRMVLQGFPDTVKKKGTLKAFQQAVYMFLKVYNIDSPASIYYVKDGLTLYNKYEVPDNTVLVGISSSFQDTSLLEDLFKYILPIGVNYFFYYYTNISELVNMHMSQKAELIFVSHNMNSLIRGSNPFYNVNEEFKDIERFIGAVDTTQAASVDSVIPKNFIGHFVDNKPFEEFITSLDIHPNDDDILVYNKDEYVYNNNVWNKLLFIGNYNELIEDVSDYTYLFYTVDSKFYIRKSNTWVSGDAAPELFLLQNYTLNP